MKQNQRQKTRAKKLYFEAKDGSVKVVIAGLKFTKDGDVMTTKTKKIEAFGSPEKIAEMLKLIGGSLNE